MDKITASLSESVFSFFCKEKKPGEDPDFFETGHTNSMITISAASPRRGPSL